MTDTVLWHAPKKGHFRGENRYFSGLDFIARITLHIPPKSKHPIRRYGIYSSRTRGTGKRRPALSLRAAAGWYGRESGTPTGEADAGEKLTVAAKARRRAWARLLA
ncbi:MAG: transposase [Spirochaetales bacterium]|nr:transposase [Spirochaetales bacterium]